VRKRTTRKGLGPRASATETAETIREERAGADESREDPNDFDQMDEAALD